MNLGAASPSCAQFGDCVSPDDPSPMDADELARLDPSLELAQRAAQEVRAIRRVKRNIVVLAARALNRIDRHANQA
jgi:hypothetical protein